MKRGKPERPTITAYADHEVITPPNRLRKAWGNTAPADDPVARAEQALAKIAGEFTGWMETECKRLDDARTAVRRNGLDASTREKLFHAAHDIKGQAETFGYPLAASAAGSLCRLIELTPQSSRLLLILLDQHVDAIRAIVREHHLPHAEKMARDLTDRLRQVTEEFLQTVNKEGVADLAGASPPITPGAGGK